MPAVIAAVLVFAAASRGAYDLWAATAVHAAALALALGLVIARAWGKGESLRHDLAPFLAACAAAAGLCALFAANPGEAAWRAKDWLSAALLFLFCLNALRPEKSTRALLAVLVPFFCLQFAFVLYQRYDSIFAKWLAPFPPGWDWRTFFYALSAQVSGTMVNSNLMAAFLLLWLPPLFSRWLKARRAKDQDAWYWRAGFLSAAASLLLLNSAWAFLCAVAVAPFAAGPEFALNWARRHRFKALLALSAATVLAGLVLWWKLFAPVDLNGLPVSSALRHGRLAWWDAAWRMFLDHPWLGVGPGGFSSAYLAYKIGPGPNTHFTHSLPMELLAEIGALGLGAFLVFLSAWARLCVRSWSAVGERWPFMLGAAAFLLCTLIQPGLEYPANLLSLAVCLGASAAPVARETWKPGKLAALGLAAAGFAALPWILSPFMAGRAAAYAYGRLAAGDADGALRAYQAAVELDGLASPAQRGAAHALLARHARAKDPADLARAEAYQTRAAELDRLNGQLWWELGQTRLRLSDPAGAKEAFQEAVRRRPTSEEFRKDLERLGR